MFTLIDLCITVIHILSKCFILYVYTTTDYNFTHCLIKLITRISFVPLPPENKKRVDT